MIIDRYMKRCMFYLAALVLVALAVSCDTGEKYVVRDNVVVFTYWTFSFGTVNDTLPGADAASFRSIKNWLGCDDKQAFFKAKPVSGVDVATVKPERYPLFSDKDDYYYETAPLHVRDKASFNILDWFEHDFWAVDSQCAYFDSVRIDDADVQTFKVLKMPVAKDKNHVNYFGSVLPLADPASFEIIKNSAYARDKSHVWCGDDLLQDADLATFTVDDMYRAHDKYGAFTWERRDTVPVEEQ